MPDLESRFIPIGSVPPTTRETSLKITTIENILKKNAEAARVTGFVNYFVLSTPWTDYQSTKISQLLSQFPHVNYRTPSDYMPVSKVIIDSRDGVIGLRVFDKVYLGYKSGKTLRSLGVSRALAFGEKDQSDEQKAALNDLADWLCIVFQEAEAKYGRDAGREENPGRPRLPIYRGPPLPA